MLNLTNVDMVLFVLALAGYFCPNVLSYVLAILSWIVLYPALHFIFRVDHLNAVLSVLVFSGIQLAMISYRSAISGKKKKWDAVIREKNCSREKLLARSDELAKGELEMQSKEPAVVNLYEITKKMSAILRFDDMFRIFSIFMQENFKFNRCDLLILDEGKERKVAREYSVWKTSDMDISNGKIDRGDLVKTLSEEQKEIYVRQDGDNGPVTTAIPLSSEKKTVALLIAQDLPKAYLEEFRILAMQFALEIKKVLLYEMVERLAITDSLTGLYVRRYFSERMTEELNRSKRYKFKFAFLMIDVDNFKRCNDTYGHLVGDAVLKDIARLLKERVREIDLVCRYGGEEFAMVLPETGEVGARAAAERIRKGVEEHLFKAYDETLRMTVSIGISVYPDDASSASGLIEDADEALYLAKKSGKNVVYEYKK